MAFFDGVYDLVWSELAKRDCKRENVLPCSLFWWNVTKRWLLTISYSGLKCRFLLLFQRHCAVPMHCAVAAECIEYQLQFNATFPLWWIRSHAIFPILSGTKIYGHVNHISFPHSAAIDSSFNSQRSLCVANRLVSIFLALIKHRASCSHVSHGLKKSLEWQALLHWSARWGL